MLAGILDNYLATDTVDGAVLKCVQRASDNRQCFACPAAGASTDIASNIFRYVSNLNARIPSTMVPYTDVAVDQAKSKVYLIAPCPAGPSLAEVLKIRKMSQGTFEEDELYALYAQIRETAMFLADTPGYARLFSSHGSISLDTVFLEDIQSVVLTGYGVKSDGELVTDLRDTAQLLRKLMDDSAAQAAQSYSPEFLVLVQRCETETDFPAVSDRGGKAEVAADVKQSVTGAATPSKTQSQTFMTEQSLLLSSVSQTAHPLESSGGANAPQVELSTARVSFAESTVNQNASLRDNVHVSRSILLPAYSDLIDAVTQKNLDKVMALVRRGVVPSPSCAKTALMTAASLGYFELAQVLVDTEARHISAEGYTALHYALEGGNFSIVTLLADLETRKYPTSYFNNKLTNLLFAVETDDLDAIWYWHKHQCTMLNSDGFTALHLATMRNYVPAIRILAQCEYGIADKAGKVSLHYCAEKNYVEAAKILAPLEQGVTTPEGLTSLQIAYNMCHFELCHVLLPYEGPKDTVPTVESNLNTDLMLAVIAKNSFDIFCYMRQARTRNMCGMTALMLAAQNGCQAAIEELIDIEGCMQVECTEGAFDGVAADTLGQTALMFAAAAGMLSAAARLSGKEAGMIDANGETALMKATRANHPKVVDLLAPLENNIRESSGKTALTIAIQMGHKEVCDILKHYEGPPSDQFVVDAAALASGSVKLTPLMKAADAGNFNYVWCLMDQKDYTDSRGWTALMFAAANGHTECCEMLVETRNAVSLAGETAWKIAQNNGHTHLLDLLQPEIVFDDNGNCNIHRVILTSSAGNTKQYTHQYKMYNKTGLTALMIRAASKATGPIDPDLIEAEATMRSRDGKTFALKIALLNGNADLVKTLYPFEKSLLDEEGYTELMMDAFYGRIDQIVVKADQYCKQTVDGVSALMIACAAGQVAVARLLLGSEIGLQTQDGLKASHFAVQSNNADLCNLVVPLELSFTPAASAPSLSSVKTGALSQFAQVDQDPSSQQDGPAASLSQSASAQPAAARAPLALDRDTLLRWEKQLGQSHRALQKIVGPSPAVDSAGNTVLHRAALSGDIETVHESVYLARAMNNMRQTALMFAAAKGHTAIVEILAYHEANMVDMDGHCAAELAIISGHIESIAILAPVEKKLLVDAGYTPLMFAVLADDADAVSKYIAAGQLRMQTRTGQTALIIAILLARQTLIEPLLEERDLCMKNGITAHVLASSEARRSCFTPQIIVSLKSPIIRDSNGNSQLMQKAIAGETDYVKAFLYMHGEYNSKGYTALHLAVVNSRPKCVAILKTVEARARLRGTFGIGELFPVVEPTALMIAAIRNDTECTSELLASEATMTDTKGRTALMLAAIYGNARACSLLAPYEARCQDNFDTTALMLSAMYGHADCAEVLVEFEANQSTPAGDTALTYASENGRISCVELLAPREAKQCGARAVAIAKEANKAEIQRIIRSYL